MLRRCDAVTLWFLHQETGRTLSREKCHILVPAWYFPRKKACAKMKDPRRS